MIGREEVLLLVRMLQIQQERQLSLQAQINALNEFVCRLSPDAEEAQNWLQRTVVQFQQSEADREEREQLDTLLKVLEQGKNPNVADA